MSKRTTRRAIGAVLLGLAISIPTAAQTVVGPSPKPPVQLVVEGLDVEVVPSAVSASPGERLTYTVTITNRSGATSTGVSLIDRLPVGLTATASRTATFTHSFSGPLAPGKTFSVSYGVQVADGLKPGDYQDAVTVSADNTVSVMASAIVSVDQPTSGAVLGAEAELPASGPGLIDVVLFTLGSGLTSVGVIGLRRR